MSCPTCDLFCVPNRTGAGALFGSLCPGVELSPPIRYNGSVRKGKLEKVFEAAAKGAISGGETDQMGKLDRLQVQNKNEEKCGQ